MKKRKASKGFTLIELVMIIIIIAIIAAIAIPKFTDLGTNAKNAADEYTVRKVKAVVQLLYCQNQIAGNTAWPTGAEIAAQLPGLNMTAAFTANIWRYDDTGDTVVFYCDHGAAADATGRRWWTYYRATSGENQPGDFIEGSSDH